MRLITVRAAGKATLASMLSGITSSSATASTSANTASGAASRAQLARLQKEYTECVNCDSAKTIEGKRNLQALDQQIGALKASLDKPPASASVNAATAAAPSTAASGNLGTQVNVFA